MIYLVDTNVLLGVAHRTNVRYSIVQNFSFFQEKQSYFQQTEHVST